MKKVIRIHVNYYINTLFSLDCHFKSIKMYLAMMACLKSGLFLLQDAKKRTALGTITVLISACILIAGLWPFNFHPYNKVAWSQNECGIEF